MKLLILLFILIVLIAKLVNNFFERRGDETPRTSPRREVSSEVVYVYPSERFSQTHTRDYTPRQQQTEDLREQYRRWCQNNEDLRRVRSKLV